MDNSFKGRSLRQSFDWKLVICCLLLILIGWVNIYASIHSSEPSSIFDGDFRSGKQFIWILTAFGISGLILFVIPPRLWESASVPIYIGAVVLLVAVIFLGIEVKGSRSWFEFGPVRFQPAEVSKISTSLLLAFALSRPGYRISKTKDFLTTAAIILLPMLVILAENETGSALVYVGFIFMLYREGLSGWFIVLIGLVILIFILTLTTSQFTAAAVLLGLLMMFNSALTKRPVLQVAKSAAAVTAIAFLPAGWNALCAALIPGARILESVSPDIKSFFLSRTNWDFLLNISPFHILLAISAPFIPWLIHKAFKEKKHILAGSAAVFIAGILLIFSTTYIFNNVLKDHQRARIEELLGITEDPMGVGYNVNQSMIAIGSGGFSGKGFLNGTQTSYGFVPEQSTDFIFCTVGEEWGFIGCLAVIALYVFIIWRIITDAEHSRESFTRIYGYCTACCLFMHLFINIGMTIGIVPVIGIPLPLVSYGGSSLWTFTAMISIFLILDHEEKKYF